eukprot:TRINITY_DN4541_c0_g1_i1.p1 TRINITY_DN4541_c0_g1~~TRINITY_DN4541_c0_g1_i1.p1  ORF type:complete len:487 (+),score=94.15 TRINITY_DN4541_c0_g1_i1:468-1928(+)
MSVSPGPSNGPKTGTSNGARPTGPSLDNDGSESMFDLESYISNYRGHTKITRLRFIADRAVSKELASEALRMALKELKEGENTMMYKDTLAKAVKLAGGSGGSEEQQELDASKKWIESVDRKAVERQMKLEAELNAYKTNLIKESIRMGYNDLGDFHYERGELQAAFKSYARSRDYCTTTKHITSMCLNVILVSIELGHYVHVTNYVTKAEQSPDVTQDPLVLAQLKCAAGLANLEAKKYKMAARKFVEAQIELGSQYSEVISPQDVATYGALCSLASFDRGELKEKVIDNISFKNFLELVPEVRELITDFYASRYASCLKYLQKLKPALLLDVHLHEHVETLYEQIRHSALIQYTLPFLSVDLVTMAAAFNTDVAGLEQEVAKLIMDNQIQARIDSHRKILFARHADQRHLTFQRALQAGAAYQVDTRALLLRANLSGSTGTQAASGGGGGAGAVGVSKSGGRTSMGAAVMGFMKNNLAPIVPLQ